MATVDKDTEESESATIGLLRDKAESGNVAEYRNTGKVERSKPRT